LANFRGPSFRTWGEYWWPGPLIGPLVLGSVAELTHELTVEVRGSLSEQVRKIGIESVLVRVDQAMGSALVDAYMSCKLVPKTMESGTFSARRTLDVPLAGVLFPAVGRDFVNTAVEAHLVAAIATRDGIHPLVAIRLDHVVAGAGVHRVVGAVVFFG
jgi:hypothetical protein